MFKNDITKGIIESFIISLVLIFLIFLFELSFVSYILIASVISLIGQPIVAFFNEKLKLKIITSTLITMFIILSTIIGIISLFIPLIIEQGKNLSLLDLNSFEQNINFLYAEFSKYLLRFNINLDQSIFNIDWINEIDFGFIPEILNSLGKTLGNLTIGLLSIFHLIFLLKDSTILESHCSP